MDRDLPPERLPDAPPPPRPDLLWSPPVERPTPPRAGTRALAFAVVLAVTIATLGGGLLAIERVTAPEGDASEHKFIAFTIDGSPMRWNPCQTINYVINPASAPEGSIDDVHEAVQRVSRATGIPFAYRGLTDEEPMRQRATYQPDVYGNRWAPVLIAWVDPDDTDLSFERDGHEAAAVASPATPFSGQELFVSGQIAMNLEDPNPPGFAWPGAQGPVLLHELGHIMGLAHVSGAGEIMHESGGGVTDYGPGDLEGLRRLGRQAGCLAMPDPG